MVYEQSKIEVLLNLLEVRVEVATVQIIQMKIQQLDLEISIFMLLSCYQQIMKYLTNEHIWDLVWMLLSLMYQDLQSIVSKYNNCLENQLKRIEILIGDCKLKTFVCIES